MDELDDAMQSNQVVLYIGCALILFYIALVLGRLNSLEQRVFLSLMGMLVIGFSIGASFGVCFFMRIFYADMHPTIPFLMLGIGVDDMFVVVQALENLKPKEKKLPVEQRVALTMKSAGVSITVTSLTDIGAFLIGSTTVSAPSTIVKEKNRTRFRERVFPDIPSRSHSGATSEEHVFRTFSCLNKKVRTWFCETIRFNIYGRHCDLT